MRSVPAKRHMKFVKGMDLSTLLELERCGAKYYDNGEERDLLAIMKSYDVDTIRIRLWNDPWSETGVKMTSKHSTAMYGPKKNTKPDG